MTHIYIVEDDLKLGQLILDYLQQQGFKVSLASTGAQALEQIPQLTPDLILLDLMLPDTNGLTLCQSLSKWFQGGILVLTAIADDMDQVAALEMGADDFIQKPIQPRVLLARIRAYLRRSQHDSPSLQESKSALQLHMPSQRAKFYGQDLGLTAGEFELLAILWQHQDQVQSRESLVMATRGIDYDGLDRTVDAKITALRRKLNDNPAQPQILITVRGKGYLLSSAGLEQAKPLND